MYSATLRRRLTVSSSGQLDFGRPPSIAVLRTNAHAGDEQMNIEQGMSKEEGRGLSEEMATRNTKHHEERYKLDVLEDLGSAIQFVLCFWRLFVANTLLPSTFLVRHSSVS